MITYQNNLIGIHASRLEEGFFKAWARPLTPAEHMTILRNSAHVVLAVDDDTGKVVGFVNALSDGVRFAFIPMIEVLPPYRMLGVGSQLMHRMLEQLAPYGNIDLTCDPEMQPFYERFSMIRSHGMVVRDYI